MVYTANWVIIYHLPPIKGTRNNHWGVLPKKKIRSINPLYTCTPLYEHSNFPSRRNLGDFKPWKLSSFFGLNLCLGGTSWCMRWDFGHLYIRCIFMESEVSKILWKFIHIHIWYLIQISENISDLKCESICKHKWSSTFKGVKIKP